MVTNISWTLNVQVSKGPGFSISQVLSVEAYDKIEVVVPGGDSTTPGQVTVDVQPGGSGKVKFLLITSTLYEADLTYSVDGVTSTVLDSPQLLVGAGAVGLLGSTQNQFVFNNEAGANKEARVQILVGRDPTA